MKQNIIMIDPPSGWKYNFPKQYHEEDFTSLRDFLLINGYPKEDIEYWGDNFPVGVFEKTPDEETLFRLRFAICEPYESIYYTDLFFRSRPSNLQVFKCILKNLYPRINYEKHKNKFLNLNEEQFLKKISNFFLKKLTYSDEIFLVELKQIPFERL